MRDSMRIDLKLVPEVYKAAGIRSGDSERQVLDSQKVSQMLPQKPESSSRDSPLDMRESHS
jgi:hypothetical protein